MQVSARRHQLAELHRRVEVCHPRAHLASSRAALIHLEMRSSRAMGQVIDARSQQFSQLVAKLEALSPLQVLARGFALAQVDGRVITDASSVRAGDSVQLRLSRGRLECRVEKVTDHDEKDL